MYDGLASRINALRRKAGLCHERLAEITGINEQWMRDVTARDNELPFTLSVEQALRLAAALGVGLRKLLCPGRDLPKTIPFSKLAEMVRLNIAAEGITQAQFEDKAGWYLSDFLAAPAFAATQPIIFFEGLCKALGIDLLAVLPDSP